MKPVLLALLVLCAVLLAACGGGGDPATDDLTTVPTPRVVCPSVDLRGCI